MSNDLRNLPVPVAAPSPPPVPWWFRALSRLPLGFWYRVCDLLTWVAEHLVKYRRRIIESQLRLCFPDMDEATRKRTRIAMYRNFGDVFAEILKSATMPAAEFRQHVQIRGLEQARRHLDGGQSVLLVASHVCNWEWMLLGLSLELGHPFDAAYKPLRKPWAERLLLALRSRFGARMVPAGGMLGDVLQRRGTVRGIGIVADQDPVSAELRHFTLFLGQPTAFYMGVEAIARAARLPVLFVGMRRLARGRYQMDIEPMLEPGERLSPGGVMDRYAARVEALVREQPADWLWTYRRWRAKPFVYGARGAEGRDGTPAE